MAGTGIDRCNPPVIRIVVLENTRTVPVNNTDWQREIPKTFDHNATATATTHPSHSFHHNYIDAAKKKSGSLFSIFSLARADFHLNDVARDVSLLHKPHARSWELPSQ